MIDIFWVNTGVAVIIWSAAMYYFGYWRSDKHFIKIWNQLKDDGVVTDQMLVIALNRAIRKRKGLYNDNSKTSK